MEAATLTLTISLAFYLFQTLDFIQIAREFGVPCAFAILIFLYFSSQIKKRDSEANAYRQTMIEIQEDQTRYLRTLVGQFKCGYEGEKKHGRQSSIS